MNPRTFREKSLYAPLKDKTMFPNPKIKNSLRIEELSHLPALLPEGNIYNEKLQRFPNRINSNGCPIPQHGLQTSTSDNFHTHITIQS